MLNRRYILFILLACVLCVCPRAYAQLDTVRYVRMDGDFNNDGRSWATAKNRVQDAINDLRDYLRANNLTSGSVYIAAGEYSPTESTEASGGSMLHTSFKIYDGIHVYGGFNPDSPESHPSLRQMVNNKLVKDNWARMDGGTVSGDDIASQWDLKYKTILDGNHSPSPVVFAYDNIRGRYNVTYPASSYHVVWFATNGKYETDNDSVASHFRPLEYPASLDGCVIRNGNASSRSTTIREHTAYGGGVYMVGNSELRNCTVEKCNATMRGGGVYLDGGGVVEFCYIHTCQSPGVGVVQGYGGGVCIDYDGSVGHSHITNCAARCGGGLTIGHIPSEYPVDRGISYYSPYATACVINNNTAAAEAGAIYLAEGGLINHCTVTANNCIGPDVTYYGRRHGRSGGIYIRDCGMIYNSVFWGNKCATNNDIQFASVRQVADTTGHKVFVYHTAFMNHDISDWTGVQKEVVFSLDKHNLPVYGSSNNFPCFFAPTVAPDNWTVDTLPGAGVFKKLVEEDNLSAIPGPRIWHLTSYSALDQKGVQVTDAIQGVSEWILHAHTDYGVVTNPFRPVSTLGALVRRSDPTTYALIPPQGTEGRNGGDPIPTIFIDPNRKGVFGEDGKFVYQTKEGYSWDHPLRDLGEAIQFFRQYLVDDDGGNHHYKMPKLDDNGFLTDKDTTYNYVQILVKEGTINTAGPGNYLDKNIRTAAVRVESHMRLYGGYPTKLTGTDTRERNPRDHVTTITANVTGIGGTRGYENNSAHVIAMVNVEHAIVDGFTLSDANTHNITHSHSVSAGGGVLVNNSSVAAEKRIHMTGNKLRNCVITNCSSPKGAAVYVNGEYKQSDGTVCYAELKMVNCVIRNNTADYQGEGGTINDHGIITANGRAYIEIEHCDIVNNVGYPFKADNKTTETDEEIVCTHPEHNSHGFHGFIRVNNSIIFCNGATPTDDRGDLGKNDAVMSVFPDGQAYVFGEYNMFDKDLRLQLISSLQPRGFFDPDFDYDVPSDFVPAGDNFGASLRARLPEEKNNQAIFTRTDRSALSYPGFINPSRNVGHSAEGDKPLYGGIVSYAPLTTNPCVNAASAAGYSAAENYDRTDNNTRTFGGDPDIGAIENTDLPLGGSVIYVTPEGRGRKDGSSWSNAIAGNTVYRLYNAPAADGDSVDIASGARLINQSTGEPVLTTDTRYCGGYARKYEYTMSKDVTRSTTTSMERNIYVGGDSDRIDTISTGTPSTKTTTGDWYTDGVFYDGYDPSLAVNADYPYGEMSGASRAVFRATDNFSPMDDNNSAITTFDNSNATKAVNSGQIIIRNERKENYVSGLQYAVEQASMLNKTLHEDSVQVWVGAGKYTDYKGFVMRDSVTVLGGFPAGKFQAPGMNERRALMSNVVAIPKSKENKDLDPGDYETILQISDDNPKKSNTAINTAAIKFYDNGPSIKWQFTKNIDDTLTHFTDNYYRWEATGKTDVSATYIRYPDMLANGSNVWGMRKKDMSGGTGRVDSYTSPEECGGVNWGGTAYVYQYFGDPWKNIYENHGWELVYANGFDKVNINWDSFKFDGSKDVLNGSGDKIGTVSCGMALTGCMRDMSVWQTMKHVPAGSYQLEIDLGAYYTNAPTEENTGITFYIIDAEGTQKVSREIFCNGDKLRQYIFNFEQPIEGDLIIRLMSAPGNQNPTWNDAANTRKVYMANVHLYEIGDPTAGEYVLDHTTTHDVSSGTSMKVTPSKDTNWRSVNNRTTLRKRVLTMPDVTNPVYGSGLGDPKKRGAGQLGDALAHFERVIKDSRKSNSKTGGGTINGRHQDPNYKEYNEANWDGFTIRHGFIYDQCLAHGGGAGVNMYEGGHLANCIVTDNWAGAMCMKGGGVFCDGSNSTIENCFILNNVSTKGTQMTQEQEFAGGLFMYEGTCFNTLIANNYAHGFGGGLGLCVGKFYNNTVAYNHGEFANYKSGNKKVGGLRIASGAASSILIANSILYGNNGLAVDMTDNSDYAPFLNCYIQSTDAITKGVITHAINNTGSGNYGVGNAFHNGQAASANTTPFGADVNRSGVYTDSARIMNNFALRQVEGIHCVNSGTEDFAGTLEEALAKATTSAIPEAKRAEYRAAVAGVELPANDVVYADRVQDCQVDIGAYEYDGTKEIRPDTTSHPGQAIFYITFNSPGGDASGRSPENAACKQKLQKVLDAAGRYKYKLMTNSAYNLVDPEPKVDKPDKSWTVEVWLEGDNTNCTTSDHYADWYTPTRSTKHDLTSIEDNPLDYSFIIPHGVQVKGGYSVKFFHYEDAAGNEVEAGTPGATVKDERDPLSYRSVLSGKITSNTGAEGNCYHVVTFTDNLFALNQYMMDEGGQLAPFSSLADAENHRAVLDGLFIEDGYANSPDEEDRIGAGAVVTGYAHIRNCVVQRNEASGYGGGLYLLPKALVSGTIIKKNTADVGGGVYIEAPLGASVDSLAHIYTTTICENTANTTAGGMWFYETNARVNSSVLWHNRANDFANVSGTFTRTNNDTDYPFIFCGVESRRLEGLGNIELSPSETEGVRWDKQDPFHAILYYPIEMSSTLSRSGMTYTEWNNARIKYPTLETADIAGVCRTQWETAGVKRGYSWIDTLVVKNNDFIEMGARALNKSFVVEVDKDYVMRRLYVMHTDLLNSEAARALQDNTNTDANSKMYSQMGSCTLNPFHRLGDAFDYIIATRKKDPEKYRNARFEVYVEKGTYFPYRNAYGEQDEVRTNTFLIPEGTTVIGGINSQKPGHSYGQAGYIDKFTNTKIGDGSDVTVNVKKADNTTATYTINYALADSIRMRNENHRSMSDYNLNSIIEPWELERQTILSGNVVSGEDFTHVYHVVTVHADSAKIGPQPLRYKKANPDADWEGGTPVFSEPIAMNKPEDFDKECDLSVSARSIILDGITITGGYANQVDPADINRHTYHAKTYFRGGGIFIDGNWTESFETGHDIPNVTDPAKHNIPLIVRNCKFSDNMAGNGGAIYSNGSLHVYSSHFTQNYSQGPMTKEDQKYIPWSAGGCIAANAYCGVVNVLFDNNEARRGLYPIAVKGADEIPNADARQGFGGVLSIAENAKLRAANCHFMRNKAVAYSAVYNFKPNNEYANADDKQYVFNSIFWGNEIANIESIEQLESKEAPSQAAIDSFLTVYKPSRSAVFHYDGKELAKYERLYHEYDSLYELYSTKEEAPYVNPSTGYPDTFNIAVTDKLAELRAQGNKIEGLYFCSYRKTYGPSSMRSDKEGYMLTQEEQRSYTDPRGLKIPLTLNDVTGDWEEYYTDLFTYVRGNNNVLINRINNASDGPNFKQPSFVAGLDGYMQNADWLLARINLTTDQGWGHLKQTVIRPVEYHTRYTGSEHFASESDAIDAANAALGTDTCTKWSVLPISGIPTATFNAKQDTAMYNFLAARTMAQFGDNATPYIPIGTDQYMTYTRNSGEESISGQMYRISPNPRLRVEDAYIDMGVYEYQYVQLDLKGNEVDTIWVATTQKGLKHDGLTWETPTTDLQSAIDILMSSHNNHDKYICFLGSEDQSIAPTDVIDNRRAFVLSSSSIAPLLPDNAMADTDYAVKSISFLGGYSYDVKDAPRDPQAYPTVIEMLNLGHQSQLNQLFVINDMTRMQHQANWMGERTDRDSVVIPVTFDGITFINPYSVKDQDAESSANIGGMVNMRGGAAIYYRWQRQYETVGEGGVFTPDFSHALYPDSAEVDGAKITLPKLTISNCIFMDNGARTDDKTMRSAAVRIDQGGGSSLIVNSLFHSNAGAPIYAKRRDELEAGAVDKLSNVPNDVVVVNSTFALNDGHITLKSDNSEVHNSLIWMDDLASDTLTQLELNNDKWDKLTNKSKPGIADRMTHNAVWGCIVDGDETYHNDNLATLNSDVFEGPCFSNPNVSATTSEERRSRDFHINPSIRTMNMADSMIYRTRVFYRIYPDTCTETHNKYWRRSNGFKSIAIVSLANDSDLAAKPRVYGVGMERGAYECLAVLQRVLYVQPNRPLATAGDGSSWLSPFGQGQLQNAIDAAAVYTYLNDEAADPETRKSYVFVKGSYDSKDEYHIIARDGVNIYGSIPEGFNDTAWIDPVAQQFTNEGCRHYVNYVRSISSGVGSPNATPTRISSVSTASDVKDYETGFLLDGFVITNPGKTLAESPVILDKTHAVVRNCILTENKTADSLPVADIEKGLVYNSLFYADTAAIVVRLGENGLALNNTVLTAQTTDIPIDISATTADASVNNIAGHGTELHCFAPYLTDGNVYTLPAYQTSYPTLAYQLHERSKEINAGTESLPVAFNPYTADSTVCFGRDRDILGNPRRISSVDKGALEVWRVEAKSVLEVTARTEVIRTAEEINNAHAEGKLAKAFTSNYGGHYYPHPGSVVYLMDSSAMTMQYEEDDFTEANGDPIIFRPAYMLLKPDASFYGNGHDVQLNYLAAEKRFNNQRFSMTAFPFDYNTSNITTTTYYPAQDSISILRSDINFDTYQYNGTARSAKDYVFQPNNSSLWQRVDTTNRSAMDGYLMDFGTEVDTLLRFTAFAPQQGQYVYTENADEADKIVYLEQHDNRNVTSSGIDFTRQEDMGWNMKGLPWLVSNYRTDTILEEGNFLRQMYIPHVFYQMDGDGEYITDNDNIYTSRSWDAGSKMAMGNAFLTQTATQQTREPLYFHRPYYSFNEKATRPVIRMSHHNRSNIQQRNGMPNKEMAVISDIFTAIPDSTADKNVEYRYGRDGVKWESDNASIYLMDTKRMSRISLLGATPTEVDIPVGVKVLEDEDYIFSLPEKDAFADYKYVWFIDYDHNKYTNLLTEDYTVSLPAGENNTRFAIRIDGYPKVNKNGERQYIVYAYNGTLYVRGIVEGDKIDVYSASGQHINSTIATGTEFTMPLYDTSGYLIKVNDTSHKVVNISKR